MAWITVRVRRAPGHGVAGVALPAPLVVAGKPPPAAPLGVVELRHRVEAARMYTQTRESTLARERDSARTYVYMKGGSSYG